MKPFKKFRLQNLHMKNFKKYILYAIGEIFLIVVGVLIAINVNNSNAERKKEKQLNSIIQKVKINLENDIQNLDTLISNYKDLDTVMYDIISGKYPTDYIDTFNLSNIKNCIPCYAYHLGFAPFHSKLDGYEQLKSVNLDWNSNKNKITQDILFFYQEKLRELKLVEQPITDEVFKNLRSIEDYDWYVDYTLRKPNLESMKYFHTDRGYKNKLATYKVLVIENYLKMLVAFRKEAKVLLETI